ncbi:sigma E protease regulator RseP [Celerinatantimonas sp. YJH-8]|uniref:sigma E protease regulator RseP n=1 Tax=Celerinatantimonas sp. YJH-8 TaxID=3228714 RepID=UPI0038BF0995
MQSFIWNVFFFIVALGVLVAIHEFGHFWVARRCGVKVERFSIGFGRRIWHHVGRDGTEYVLAMIPLGGYVKMLDERVEAVPLEMQKYAFNRQSVAKRAAIVAAGPVANFILAIIAFWLMMMIGITSVRPVLGTIDPQSVAGRAGLHAEQQVTEVGGNSVQDWNDFVMAMIAHVGEKDVPVVVKNLDQTQSDYRLDLSSWNIDADNSNQPPLQDLGITLYQPTVLLEVAHIIKESPAAQQGLQVGDKLVAINHQTLSSWSNFTEIVRHHAGSQIELSIERDGQLQVLPITPERKLYRGETIGFLGISPKAQPYPESYLVTLRYDPLSALYQGVVRTGKVTRLTLDMLGKLVTGKVSVDNLSGPISIAKGAGQSAHNGLVYFLSFLALVSVNLGILNLLPLPVLDGGHLLFFVVEAATGKPVSERVLEIGTRIGMSVLIVVMMFALFNDLMRL